jgi:hypothetical protein
MVQSANFEQVMCSKCSAYLELIKSDVEYYLKGHLTPKTITLKFRAAGLLKPQHQNKIL